MTAITQTIPSYALGISQQSDEAKLPGQVNDALNVVPDITDGLYKRPGTKYLTTCTGISTDGKWFNYFRDENEGAYIGRVARNGSVRVWRAEDGVEMTVNTTGSPSSYLTHTNDNEIQTLTINDTTFISNRSTSNSSTQVVMKSSQAPSKPDLNSVYVELKQIASRRQYSLNIFDNEVQYTEYAATTVKVNTGISNNTDGNEDCRYSGSTVHVDPATKVAVRVTAICQPYVSGYDNSPPNAQYSAQYTLRVDLLHGGSYSASKIGAGNAFTVNVAGVNHGIEITSEHSGSSRANLQQIRPVPVDLEQETGLSTSAVLNSIKAAITQTGFTATIIGNGIYIVSSGSTLFNVETLDADLFNIVKDEVNDVTSLPTACKHGYIVKVVNSQDSVSDDYHLKFVGENNRDGEGHWEECVEPGYRIEIDENTMPQVLTRTGSTTMTLGPYSWGNREVGSGNTNKNPSFINNRINKVLFHRNRLVMLSGSNIILSQPGDLGNFYNKTALTFSGVDRIDISSSSSSPNALVDGIEMNTGLVLFSSKAQFLFTTDSDILNPETAKVYSLSNYNYNVECPPISLGTTLAFTDTMGRYGRFFEMNDIRRDGEPQVIDQTKTVPRLLPQHINMIGNSKENSHIFFTNKSTNEVFGFKYFNAGDKRMQGAWFRWTFPKAILHHYVLRNRYYVIDVDGTMSFLVLNESIVNTPRITNSASDDFNINLDNHETLASSALSYNASTDKTSFTIPSRFTAGKTAAIVTESTNNRGRYELVSGSPGSTGTVTGDWTGSTLLVGEQFEMSVDLPTIYPTTVKGSRVVADTRSSLTLHRVKLNFGDVGQFTTKLTRKGKADYTDTYQSAILDGYQANRAPYLEESFRTIPIYERNTNVKLTISSTHPSPAVFQSLTWEGDYTNKYYKRT